MAVPYGTSFDHLRVADEVHYKFERCLKSLGPQAIMLARFGVGHSLGALLHALIGSRYPIVSSGNVLMSFNNRPATGGCGLRGLHVRRQPPRVVDKLLQAAPSHQMRPLTRFMMQAHMPASTPSSACPPPFCAPPPHPPHPPTHPADSIPLLSPFIAPNLRALGPILSQLATSPLRSGVEQWIELLKGGWAGWLAGLGWLASNRGG